jgi:VanZ family protein
MGMIFMFSHQPKDESIQYSRLAIYLLELLHIDLNDFTMGNASFAVRKMAHFTEYFILFLLASRANRATLMQSGFAVFFFCFLYACTDEFHQCFIPGRVGCIQDVGVDSSGAGMGALLFYLLKKEK